MLRYVLPLVLLPSVVQADDGRTRFVEANLLGIFYHEFGHALIDILQLPVFGQEEDAADVASILLIDLFFEEDAAQALAYDTAFGFLAEAELVDEVAYWGVHGPDAQRFYNTVCLFYGANPEARDGFAADLGLPDDRAGTCPDEYDLALSSWGPAFDDIAGAGDSLRLAEGAPDSLTTEVIAAEVAALNADFSLPRDLTVRVEVCGEANAFYDLDRTEIVMCTEFEDHLRDLYDLLD